MVAILKAEQVARRHTKMQKPLSHVQYILKLTFNVLCTSRSGKECRNEKNEAMLDAILLEGRQGRTKGFWTMHLWSVHPSMINAG